MYNLRVSYVGIEIFKSAFLKEKKLNENQIECENVEHVKTLYQKTQEFEAIKVMLKSVLRHAKRFCNYTINHRLL